MCWKVTIQFSYTETFMNIQIQKCGISLKKNANKLKNLEEQKQYFENNCLVFWTKKVKLLRNFKYVKKYWFVYFVVKISVREILSPDLVSAGITEETTKSLQFQISQNYLLERNLLLFTHISQDIDDKNNSYVKMLCDFTTSLFFYHFMSKPNIIWK